MVNHLNAIIAKFSWCHDYNNSTTCLLENVYCEKISHYRYALIINLHIHIRFIAHYWFTYS